MTSTPFVTSTVAAAAPVLGVVTLRDWIAAALVLIGAIALVLVVRKGMRVLRSRTDVQEYVEHLVTRIVTVVVVIVAVLYALQILEVEIGPLLGGLTIFAVIIAYALQPVIGNLIGSITLHGSRPIKPGDQIVTNGVEGTVIDIHPRATEILTFDGVTVHVPNSDVLGSVLTNRTADYERRSSITFSVDFDADLRKVQHVVETAIRNLEAISEIPRAEVLVDQFDQSGVTMVARFWHPSEELFSRWVQSEAAITIQEALRAEQISISFPHREHRNRDG